MSSTLVILNVALAALAVGVIVGMFLWAIKTSPPALMTLTRSVRRPSDRPGDGLMRPFTGP